MKNIFDAPFMREMEKTTENRRKKAGLSAPEKAAGRMGK